MRSSLLCRQPGKEGRGRNCFHLILYNKEKVDPEDMSKMYNNSQIEMVATWRGQDVSETHQHHGTKNDCKPAPRRGGGLHRARGGDDQCNSKNAILKGTEWEMQQNSKILQYPEGPQQSQIKEKEGKEGTKKKTVCPHCKRTYNRWNNLFKHMVKDRGWENAQRLPQLFRQGAAPQGAADHPDRSWKEKDIPNRPSKKMRPQGRLKLKLSLSTSTSHLNSKEGNIHTQDHHVINSEEKSSSKEEKESDSEKRQTNKPKKETNYEVLEEITGKSSRSSNPKDEETKDPDKNSKDEHKENENTEIQATVSMYFTTTTTPQNWGGTTKTLK